MLDYCIAITFDPSHSYGRKGRKSNGNFSTAYMGRFPEKRPITFHMDQNTSGKGMMISTKSCTGPTDAVMIYLDFVPIYCRKDPFTGTGGHRTDSHVLRRASAMFFLPDKHTPLPYHPVHPVLRSAAGDAGCVLEVSDGKKTTIERELPHQAQVLAPALKHAGHNGL
jgi:hypothetical protein